MSIEAKVVEIGGVGDVTGNKKNKKGKVTLDSGAGEQAVGRGDG